MNTYECRVNDDDNDEERAGFMLLKEPNHISNKA